MSTRCSFDAMRRDALLIIYRPVRLYASIVQPWNGEGRRLVCGTVENLHAALTGALPQVRSLLDNGTIALSDFAHEKFNGCEIIP